MSGASKLTLSGSAVSIATGFGQTAIAVSEYGLGRVVAISDSHLWKWDYYSGGKFDLPDNQQFALNTFEYLAVPEPATLLFLGLGAVLLRRKGGKW